MQIKALMVNCTYKKDGCTWEGELRDLKDHVADSCSCRKVQCPSGYNGTMKEIEFDRSEERRAGKEWATGWGRRGRRRGTGGGGGGGR